MTSDPRLEPVDDSGSMPGEFVDTPDNMPGEQDDDGTSATPITDARTPSDGEEAEGR